MEATADIAIYCGRTFGDAGIEKQNSYRLLIRHTMVYAVLITSASIYMLISKKVRIVLYALWLSCRFRGDLRRIH